MKIEILDQFQGRCNVKHIINDNGVESWTHYRIILQESNKEAREWYEQEAAREMWSTRTLQRNVSSQYYHRLLRSQNKDAVRGEMKQLTAPLQDKLEYIKNPVVAIIPLSALSSVPIPTMMWPTTLCSTAATNSMPPSI